MVIPDRKPLSKVAESRGPYPLRLKATEIERLKDFALRRGLGHTTFARECLLTGLKMAQVEEMAKDDTRITA